MFNNSIVNYQADDLFSSTGIGSLDKAIGLNQHGINFQSAPTLVPRNKEQPGYVFFTRPQLNMQTDNLRNMRQFYNLLSANELSQERMIRCTLDPRLQAGYRYLNANSPPVNCPLVDSRSAFINILSNNIMSLTGWPEETLTFQRSKEDVYRGTRTQPNGVTFNTGSYTLSATFRNTYSDPVLKMIHYWLSYMSATTTTGLLRPYPDYEAMDRLDCNTRIYRIILDPQRERVTKIYACGAALPASNAVSASADYNREQTISDANKDLTISFECDGMYVLDPILFYTFNGVVAAFNPYMQDGIRESSMIRLEKVELPFFRSMTYPRINPQTSEFEIWVEYDYYRQRTAQVEDILKARDGDLQLREGTDYEGNT